MAEAIREWLVDNNLSGQVSMRKNTFFFLSFDNPSLDTSLDLDKYIIIVCFFFKFCFLFLLSFFFFLFFFFSFFFFQYSKDGSMYADMMRRMAQKDVDQKKKDKKAAIILEAYKEVKKK